MCSDGRYAKALGYVEASLRHVRSIAEHELGYAPESERSGLVQIISTCDDGLCFSEKTVPKEGGDATPDDA